MIENKGIREEGRNAWNEMKLNLGLPPEDWQAIDNPVQTPEQLAARLAALDVSIPETKKRLLGDEPDTVAPRAKINRAEIGDPNWFVNDVLNMNPACTPLMRPTEQGVLFDPASLVSPTPDEETPIMDKVAGVGVPLLLLGSTVSLDVDVAVPETLNVAVLPEISSEEGNQVHIALPGAEPVVLNRADLTPDQNEAINIAILDQYEPREKVEDPNSIFKEIQYDEETDVLRMTIVADIFRDGVTQITIDRLARVHNMDARDLFEMVKDQLGENPDPNIIPGGTVLTYAIKSPLKIPVYDETETGNPATMGTAGNIASQFGRWSTVGAADLLNAMGMDEYDATQLVADEDYFVVPVQALKDNIVTPKSGEGALALAERLGIDPQLFMEANGSNGFLQEGTEYVLPNWVEIDGDGPGATLSAQATETHTVETDVAVNHTQEDVPVVTEVDTGDRVDEEPARREAEEQDQPPVVIEDETEQLPDGEETRKITDVEGDTLRQFFDMINEQIPTMLKKRYEYSQGIGETRLITAEEYDAHSAEIVEKIESGEYSADDIERANFRFLAEQLIDDSDSNYIRGETKVDLLATMIINEFVQGSETGYYLPQDYIDKNEVKPPLSQAEFSVLVSQLAGGHEIKGEWGADRNLLLSEFFERLDNGATEFREIAKGVEHTYIEGQDIRNIAKMYGVPVHYIFGMEEGDAELQNLLNRKIDNKTKLFIASGVYPEGRVYDDFHPAPEITKTNETALHIWNTYLELREVSSKVPYPSEWGLAKMVSDGMNHIDARVLIFETILGGGSVDAGALVYIDHLELKHDSEGAPVISGEALAHLVEGLKSGTLNLSGVRASFANFMETGNEIELYGLNEAETDGYDKAIGVYHKMYDLVSGKHDLGYTETPDVTQLFEDAKGFAEGTLTEKILRDRIASDSVELNEPIESVNDFYRFAVRQSLYNAGIATDALSENEETAIAMQFELGGISLDSLNTRITDYLLNGYPDLAVVLAGGIIINVEPGMQPGYIAEWTGGDVDAILASAGIDDPKKLPIGPLIIPGVVEEPSVTYESILPQITETQASGSTEVQMISIDQIKIARAVANKDYDGLNVAELTVIIENHDNITLYAGSKNNRLVKSFADLKDDGKTFTHDVYNDNDGEIPVSADMLASLIEIADKFEIQVNSMTTGEKHSEVSRHYGGMGLDIQVNRWTPELVEYLWENAERLGIHELIWNGTIDDIPANGRFTLKHGEVYPWPADIAEAHGDNTSGHVHVSWENVTNVSDIDTLSATSSYRDEDDGRDDEDDEPDSINIHVDDREPDAEATTDNGRYEISGNKGEVVTNDGEVFKFKVQDQYAPNTPEAVDLFKAAAAALGLPEEWAEMPELHRLYGHESAGGWVGIPNYTYDDYFGVDISNTSNMGLWDDVWQLVEDGKYVTDSTANGLAQMIRENIIAHYPSGLKGQGISIEEAIGLLSYISGRYHDPVFAWDNHSANDFRHSLEHLYEEFGVKKYPKTHEGY